MTVRRQQLAEQATDYVLQHGLIDFSLRPLAAHLGTSDRMLLYHFESRSQLLATVLRVSNDRSVAGIRALRPSPDVRRAVLDLWRTVSAPDQARCQRLYVEAAALGVLGAEPYASIVGEANQLWSGALTGHLVASGLLEAYADRATRLVEAAFMGLQLDEQIEEPAAVQRSVEDLAQAVSSLWGRPPGSSQ